MDVIGFTFNADIHCENCTYAYAREVPFEKYDLSTYDTEDIAGNNPGFFSMEKAIELEVIRDNEGNAIHPVFDTDEAGDSPDHCGDCGEYIDTSWHDSTIDYVLDALADYAIDHSGNVEVLDQWREKLGWCGIPNRDDCVKIAYDAVRDAEVALEA